jgi:hypothetical protein
MICDRRAASTHSQFSIVYPLWSLQSISSRWSLLASVIVVKIPISKSSVSGEFDRRGGLTFISDLLLIEDLENGWVAARMGQSTSLFNTFAPTTVFLALLLAHVPKVSSQRESNEPWEVLHQRSSNSQD